MLQDRTRFLCFLTDNDFHIELCLRYWTLDPNRKWREPFTTLLADTGLGQWHLTTLLRSACRAYLLYLRCKGCGVPLHVGNRSEFAPLTGAILKSGRQLHTPMCTECEAQARAAAHEALTLEAERTSARVARVVQTMHAQARPVDFSTLSFVLSFTLYAVLVAADVGLEDPGIPPLASQTSPLTATPGLSEEIYLRLYEAGILLPSSSTNPNAFSLDAGTCSMKFAVREVPWVLAKDTLGRSLQEIQSVLFERLEHPEPTAVEKLWYMVALDECKRYFESQCERYRFTEPGIYTDKVGAAIHHYLERCSIGQAWNIIYYAVKNLAALAQEGRHTRQHIYNMMPGAIRRYADFRLGNQNTIHPWRRASPTREAWVTSILLDKILKNGNVVFENLSGQAVYGHVDRLGRAAPDPDNL
jgi:hypothetical protein